VLPDGDLREWEAAKVAFLEAERLPSARRWTGVGDLSAKVAFASYGGGLSLALSVADDSSRAAKVAASLERADHVLVELWPGVRPPARRRSSLRDRALGIRFRLGTLRQLAVIEKPADESWREAALSAFGAAAGQGYRLEARLPLSVLTPLPAPRIETLHYRITIFDADQGDAEEEAAEPTARAEGSLRLDPALEVPEAVQRRPSVRVCMASEPDALWGFEGGWRCSLPYVDEELTEDDGTGEMSSALRLGHSILPTPPTLVWLRERVIFVNLAGVQRGLAALLDKKETIYSVLRLGVVGALDPGSTWARDSDAEPLKLPDGSWAVAVTHAEPARAALVAGGRCAAGHRVHLSILALRGCLTSTPHQPAPEPDPRNPPYLEEIFRLLLEDCEATSANDWTLSKDRRTITVHSSLYPARPPVVYRYVDGRYRR
jgi:hypothetical protein